MTDSVMVDGISYEVRTAGSLRQVQSIIGLIDCRDAPDPIEAMKQHYAVITHQVLWSEDLKTVMVPLSPLQAEVMAFLNRVASS